MPKLQKLGPGPGFPKGAGQPIVQGEAQAAVPLERFSGHLRQWLEKAQPGEQRKVENKHLGAALANPESDGSPIVRYVGPGVVRISNRTQQVANLGLSDQALGARKGARFQKPDDAWALTQLAADVANGLPSDRPGVAANPYNFAAFEGDEPWMSEPKGATHEREHPGRVSGHVDVTFTALTPVFVRAGTLVPDPKADKKGPVEDRTPRPFWSCIDSEGKPRLGIPGASVKGAVSVLFEALTNSRCRVTDDENLGWPPLYRRRAKFLYHIDEMPTESKPGKVTKCQPSLYRDQQEIPNGVDAHKYRANLFHVEPAEHTHKKKWFSAQPTSSTFELAWEVVHRYQSMFEKRGGEYHPHLVAHPENAVAPGIESWYKSKPDSIDSVVENLQKLEAGCFVWGIPRDGQLHCFGKNAHFLWPAPKSALDLMADYRERTPAQAKLADSSSAEIVFGFIGDQPSRPGEDKPHSFRGRLRFTTFWASTLAGDPVRKQSTHSLFLMPLTSPPGARAKCQPLYLAPNGEGSAAYEDLHMAKPKANTQLRGRKLYWHQRAHEGFQRDGLPGQHNWKMLKTHVELPGTPSDSQLPDPVLPQPASTRFSGRVHFTNLTKAELGALLVSLDPGLVFGDGKDGGSYGIKLGKGKPRGLGSVIAQLKLKILRPVMERCASLLAETHCEGQPAGYLSSYQASARTNAGTEKWSDIGFVRDLERLTRIPEEASVRIYPPRFRDYAWSPEWDQWNGDPKADGGGRPPAMPLARDS